MTPSRFEFSSTSLAGLIVVQRKPIEDERGSFSRFYCAEEFRKVGLRKPIVQINHTSTQKKGTVRGMHFQYPPHAEAKIVSCLKGEIYDVAVDIRRGSPTFLRWHAEVLSSDNHKSLLIPEGFAHGFQALSKECELIYLHTASYTSDAEGGLNVSDPRIAVEWPFGVKGLSNRDQSYAYIDDRFEGIQL